MPRRVSDSYNKLGKKIERSPNNNQDFDELRYRRELYIEQQRKHRYRRAAVNVFTGHRQSYKSGRGQVGSTQAAGSYDYLAQEVTPSDYYNISRHKTNFQEFVSYKRSNTEEWRHYCKQTVIHRKRYIRHPRRKRHFITGMVREFIQVNPLWQIL